MPTLETTTSIKQEIDKKTNYTLGMMIATIMAVVTELMMIIGSSIEKVHWAVPCAFLGVVIFLAVHVTRSVRDIQDLTDKLAKRAS